MVKLLRIINPLITGIFFLVWSMNSYFLLGETGRMITLVFGFFLVVYAAMVSPDKKGSLWFSLKVIFFFIIFLLIAYGKNQNTLGTNNIIFSLVCVALIISGYIIAKNHQNFEKISSTIIIIYCFLVIISSSYLILFLSDSMQMGRGFGTETEINPVGLAFVNGLLFLLLFSIFYFKKNKSFILSIFIIVAMIGSFVAILVTQSRGALIFLLFTVLLLHVKSISLSKKLLKNILVIFFIIGLFIISISFLQKQFPVIENRINGLTYRFESLISYGKNERIDRSGQARAAVYEKFLTDFISFFPAGQKNYKPYPHNQYMEIIMRWGLLGLPLLFLSIRLFFKSLKLLNTKLYINNPVIITIIVLFLFSYLQSMTSLSLEMNRMLWFGFGFLISYKNEK